MPKIGMQPIRRAQLVNATCKSIHEYGLADTTINRISRLAGVSSGIISHYFGGKNELLEATMRKLLSDLGEAVATRIGGANSAQEKIQAIIEGNFSHRQIAPESVSAWLAFWSEAMHVPALARLQRLNKRRLQSNLLYWYKRLLPEHEAVIAAEGMAALIDGLWLRGAFEANGLNDKQARLVAIDYLNRQLA